MVVQLEHMNYDYDHMDAYSNPAMLHMSNFLLSEMISLNFNQMLNFIVTESNFNNENFYKMQRKKKERSEITFPPSFFITAYMKD